MEHNFKDEPDFQLSKKYCKYFDLVNDYLTIYSKLETALHEKKLQEKGLSQFDFILLTSAPKSIGSVLSIAKLCDCGLTEDANCLLRKLLEICTSLRFINQEKDLRLERSQWFLSYEAIVKRKILNRAKQQPQDFGESISDEIKSNEQQILSDYQKAKSVYPLKENGEIEDEFKKSWSGKPFDKMLPECGMNKELVTYITLSESNHFSYADVDKVIDFENSTVRTGSEDEQIPFILIKSLLFAGEVIDLCNTEFDMKIATDLSKLKKLIYKRNAELKKETGMSAF